MMATQWFSSRILQDARSTGSMREEKFILFLSQRINNPCSPLLQVHFTCPRNDWNYITRGSRPCTLTSSRQLPLSLLPLFRPQLHRHHHHHLNPAQSPFGLPSLSRTLLYARIISVGFPWLTASVTGSFSLSHKHQTWIVMMILMTAPNQQPQTSFCSYAMPKIFLRSICVFRWTRFHERWIIIFLFVHFLIGRYDLFRHNIIWVLKLHRGLCIETEAHKEHSIYWYA